jgi:hypothetical protein
MKSKLLRSISIRVPLFKQDLGKANSAEWVSPKEAYFEINEIFQGLYDHDPNFAETLLAKYPLGVHILENLPDKRGKETKWD